MSDPELDQIFRTVARQRDDARSIARELAIALRRCAEDSRDHLAGRQPLTPFVAENIARANAALEHFTNTIPAP